MSAADDGGENDPLQPHQTGVLFGHTEAETALLDAYRGGRMPHAWLLGGPRGIGKATLAYRMARFVLAHPDSAADIVKKAKSLALAPDHPVTRHVAAQAQGDLLVLERVINEKTGKLYQDIRVEDVRRAVPFFGSTAGEGGWRVAIVDSVDELNAAGANSLLKILEEPPPLGLLLLVSHAQGSVLPTIRSRSRALTLRPLSAADVVAAAAAALEREPGDANLQEAANYSEGSVGRALGLLDGKALALRQRVARLLDGLPQLDPRALHALGDVLGGTEAETLAIFLDTVNDWLSARLKESARQSRSMKPIADAWDRVNAATRDAAEYNLERKPLVFNVFGWLAEAARG